MKHNGKTYSMENEKNEENESTCLWMLPEGCIAEIFALATPPDVCRLSLVSTSLRSAADSDSVWAKFLPSDYLSIIAKSPTPIPDFRSLKIFSLDKWTGKKCYFLGARDLNIVWSDTPENWKWISVPESRFPEVARLKIVWWLEIWGTIKAGMLSPQTSYTAYFVYKLEYYSHGFNTLHMEVSAGTSGVESKNVRIAYLRLNPEFIPVDMDTSPPKLRDDGWFELELGDFFTKNEDDYIELRIEEIKSGDIKGGLIVEGIEIRPTIA